MQSAISKEIISQDIQKMLKYVSNYQPEEMKKIFAKLSALKATLEAADLFYEASVMFAQLEAYALIRAVELSDGKRPNLTGKNKIIRASAAVWLYGLMEKERQNAIEKCKDGKTIVAVYKEINSPSKEEYAKSQKNKIAEEIKEDLKNSGVCFTKIYESHLRNVDPKLRSGVRKELRNILEKKGAVELGVNSGTYIMPKSNTQEVYDALNVRLNYIQREYANFRYIANQCKQKPHFKVAEPNENIGILNLLLVLTAYDNAIQISCYPGTKQKISALLLKINDFVQGL